MTSILLWVSVVRSGFSLCSCCDDSDTESIEMNMEVEVNDDRDARGERERADRAWEAIERAACTSKSEWASSCDTSTATTTGKCVFGADSWTIDKRLGSLRDALILIAA